MEKLRISRKEQFCNRLLKDLTKFFLITILLFSTKAFCITPSEISKITIRPEHSVFFTNQELKYILEIPEVQPHNVQTQLQENMKEGVSFISSRRMEYFTADNVTGTRIEFWFTFKDAGIATIPALIVKVNGRTYYLKFDKVQLYENPKTIAPRLVVELNSDKIIYPTVDGKKSKETFKTQVTKPVEITVYAQFAVQIKQFGFEIPKESLFEEVERYDMAMGKVRYPDFSQERIPVAKFKWTPLKEGKKTLPNIRAVVTAYSGRNLELGLPDCTVTVEKKSAATIAEQNKKDAEASDFSVFAYALSEPVSEENVKELKVATDDDFFQIASLRKKERNSFGPSGSIRNERIALEQSIGIAVSRDEPSIPLWQLFVIIFVVTLSLSVLFFVFKKKLFSVIAFCLAIIFGFFTLLLGIFVSEKHAVVRGGDISPVPEESSISSTSVTAGTCVRIMEETPDWYYIEYNENGGWMKKINLIIIE